MNKSNCSKSLFLNRIVVSLTVAMVTQLIKLVQLPAVLLNNVLFLFLYFVCFNPEQIWNSETAHLSCY